MNPIKLPIQKIFTHRWIINHLGFMFFLAFLAVIYISNGHWNNRTVRSIDKLKNEIKQLQFEYKTVEAGAIEKTRMKQIVKLAQPLELKRSGDAPTPLNP